MLVIDDVDFRPAVQQLRSVGFRSSSLPYGSLVPASLHVSKVEDLHRSVTAEYNNLDRNSVQFSFPEGEGHGSNVILLPSSYAQVSVRLCPRERFTRDENVFYPDSALLLQSFIKTLVREPVIGMWTWTLNLWATTHIYRELGLGERSLEFLDDEAKHWLIENCWGLSDEYCATGQ